MTAKKTNIFLTLCFALSTQMAIAQYEESDSGLPSPTVDGPPVIVRHSRNFVSLYQGDKLELYMETLTEARYRWTMDGRVICETKICQIASERWPPGKYLILASALNKLGTQQFEYRFRIVPKPNKVFSKTIRPQLEVAKKVETLGEGDMYIQSLGGLGYLTAFKQKEELVTGRIGKKIEWNERIRTGEAAQLRFGLRKTEEHIALPDTLIKLNKTDERVIQLQKGTLRSRQIDPSVPMWRVEADSDLQVNVDSAGDVIIDIAENKTENGMTTTIVALRGQVHVSWESKAQKNSQQSKSEIYLPVGSQIKIYADRTVSDVTRPELTFLEKNFATSSPQYLLDARRRLFSNETRGAYISREFANHKDISLDKVYLKLRQFEEQRDPMRVLEYSLPLLDDNAKDLRLLKHSAKAYRLLGFLKPAEQLLKRAENLTALKNEKDSEIVLLQADIASEKREWDQALKLYADAELLPEVPLDRIYYGQGIAYFMKEEFYFARSRFRKVGWVIADPKISKSAQEFVVYITNQHALGAKGQLAFGHDSNAYSWSGSLTFPESEYGKNAGMFYLASGQIYYRGYEDASGRFYLKFDGSRRGYFDTSMAAVSIIDQTLSSEFALDFGGDVPEETVFGVALEPYLRLLMIGDERSADIFGLKTSIYSRSLRGKPKLTIDYASMSDPLPNRDDRLDPVRFEPTVASDRTATMTTLGLGIRSLDFGTGGIDTEMIYSVLTHESPYVKPDDFTLIGLRNFANYRFLPTVELFGHLNFEFRTFKDASARKDQNFALGMGTKYYFSPDFGFELKYQTKSVGSSEEVYSYRKSEVIAGTQLDL